VIRRSYKLTRYFCLDRAGLVGRRRNPSRRFDLAYLRCIPNMIIYSPLSEIGLQNILYTAQLGLDHSHPLSSWSWCSTGLANQNFGNYEKLKSVVHCLKHGTETAVLSNGPIGKTLLWP
jgi:1-deoxy-D-xylulose-5-phosphate synthase